MKSLLLTISFIFLAVIYVHAQTGREIDGSIIDSTKASLPGSFITLTSEQGDSAKTAADNNGKFAFQGIKGSKITLSITSIGYQAIRKHYTFTDMKPVVLNPIVMQVETNMLNQVTIKGVNGVVFKEDTTQYDASAYKVRANAPLEDVIKKLPGVDVDVNGNITAQGTQVTKVRVNGKDFMAGDVQSLTKNLPADVVENIQMIDDYGDQANLTGVKTGDPQKIMNITIRADRNHGYTLQATGGDGEDALPSSDLTPDANRYLGTLNTFVFNGNQEIALLGSVNNTNVNTFSFGSNSATGGGGFGGGGGGGGGFGGGGGRGNAARAITQNQNSLATTANGITDANYIGANFRDQWGKNLSVYGSYSFGDNTVATNTLNQQTNYSNGSVNTQNSQEVDVNINHRFTFNMEYKPDTANYFKITPTFSYASTGTIDTETVNQTSKIATIAYNSFTNATSTSPTYGLTVLYNHKFPHRHNFSLNTVLGSTTSTQDQTPVYHFLPGSPITTAPRQIISTYSRTNSLTSTASYLLPVSKTGYLEFNYAYSVAVTDNNTQTDTSMFSPVDFLSDSALSNTYHFTFTTNRFGINYRVVQKKYNFTLGLGGIESVLNGYSPATNSSTYQSIFNIVPTARYVYMFSRSHIFSVNYSGSSSAPSFSQLQPVINFSNALYPVEGNPNLKPQFSNNLLIRYNSFDFASGNVLFTNLNFTQTNNYITTNTITYPRIYTPDARFSNTILTDYANVNGYYTGSANVVYAKPWDNRKFTLQLTGSVSYTNTIGYLTNIDSTANGYVSNKQENISKNLQFTPGLKFRTDITDIVDVQFLTTYAINHTSNSVQDSLTTGTENVRTWTLQLAGKNYFGDWTYSYDYTKTLNYGYASDLKITNPNVLNMYVERRFLKNNAATIRFSVFDLFNQNTGYSVSNTPSSYTYTNVNRLSRYYLATFTLRLQKFAGKAPSQDPSSRGFRRDGPGGGGPGGGGGGPGGGGPPGGGPD